MDAISLRPARADDAETLSVLGWRTFVETFVHGFAMPYSRADLDAFHAASYGPRQFAALLANPASHGWIAEQEGEAVGFATVGPVTLPHAQVNPADGELKRLYVLGDLKGAGLAGRLMDEAMGWLERDGPRRTWLGVWSGNLRAQRFYARHGFEKVGEYVYTVGETLDHEFIMRRG